MYKKLLSLIIAACIAMSLFGTAAFAQEVTATKTESTITLDGEVKTLEAYNIDGSNYFKLRDVAYILSGTPKQFDVTYDTEKKAINLVTNTPYTPVGGEMETNADGDKSATATTSAIYLNGEQIQLTAYNIDGSNYFKLRDLGNALDFGVEYDDGTKTIAISSKANYAPESAPEAVSESGYTVDLDKLSESATGEELKLYAMVIMADEVNGNVHIEWTNDLNSNNCDKVELMRGTGSGNMFSVIATFSEYGSQGMFQNGYIDEGAAGKGYTYCVRGVRDEVYGIPPKYAFKQSSQTKAKWFKGETGYIRLIEEDSLPESFKEYNLNGDLAWNCDWSFINQASTFNISQTVTLTYMYSFVMHDGSYNEEVHINTDDTFFQYATVRYNTTTSKYTVTEHTFSRY